jgi:2-phospho-L-lactate transferase/gluconeogenesis factor (CofD/UPF0052 family)
LREPSPGRHPFRIAFPDHISQFALCALIPIKQVYG